MNILIIGYGSIGNKHFRLLKNNFKNINLYILSKRKINVKGAIIISSLIEIKNIIHKHQVGLIVQSVTPTAIAQQVKYLQSNTAIYATMCENCKKAKVLLNAQNEQEIFKKIVSNVR